MSILIDTIKTQLEYAISDCGPVKLRQADVWDILAALTEAPAKPTRTVIFYNYNGSLISATVLDENNKLVDGMTSISAVDGLDHVKLHGSAIRIEHV